MERPSESTYYDVDPTGRYRFVAWSPPPSPGDELCKAIIGRSESQLVQDILDGKYDDVLIGGRCGYGV